MGLSPVTTFFKVNGLERRWDWEWDDALGGYQYTVVVELDGHGAYIDFRGVEVGEKGFASKHFQYKKSLKKEPPPGSSGSILPVANADIFCENQSISGRVECVSSTSVAE